jgi:membrane-anchored glycerophosphoryl diester phosphodiesterase (GDPDase)
MTGMAMYGGPRGIRLRPLEIGDVLDETFRVYKQSFVQVITVMAIVVVPSALLSLIATLLLIGVGVGASQGAFEGLTPEIGMAALGAGIGVAFIMVLVAIVTSLAQLVAAGVVVRVASNTILGRPTAIGDAYREALGRFGRLLGVSVCISVPLMLLVVTCIGIPVAVFVGLGWSLVFQAIVLEGEGIFDAMRRSWGLVDGHRWRLLACFVLIGLIQWLLLSIPSGVIGVVTAAVVGVSGNSVIAQGIMQIVQTIFQAAAQTLFTPVGYITATLIYYDLLVRKEALDLQQRLPGVEIAQAPGYPQYPQAPQYPQYPPQYPQAPQYPPQYPQASPQYPQAPQYPQHPPHNPQTPQQRPQYPPPPPPPGPPSP